MATILSVQELWNQIIALSANDRSWLQNKVEMYECIRRKYIDSKTTDGFESWINKEIENEMDDDVAMVLTEIKREVEEKSFYKKHINICIEEIVSILEYINFFNYRIREINFVCSSGIFIVVVENISDFEFGFLCSGLEEFLNEKGLSEISKSINSTESKQIIFNINKLDF